MNILRKLMALATAAAATFTALPLHAFAARAEADVIRQIELRNITDVLHPNRPPAFTAALSEKSAAQMTVTEEYWRELETGLEYSRSSGLAIPPPEEYETPLYAYFVELTAAEGYTFPESFTLYYEGEAVSQMDYDATVKGSVCTIRCDFIGLTEPTPAGTVIDTVELENVSRSFSAGDVPVFTANVPEDAGYTLVFESWSSGTEYVTSNPQYNNPQSASLLEIFREGVTYQYLICVQPADGCSFAEDLRLLIDGKQVAAEATPLGDSVGLRTGITMTAEQPAVTATAETTVTTTVTTTAETTVTTTVTTTAETTVTTAVTTTAETTVTTTVTTEDLSGILPGDMNQDGRLTVSDAVLLIRLAAEDGFLPFSQEALKAADVDRDGRITVLDAVQLLRQLTETDVQPQPPSDAWVQFLENTAPVRPVLPEPAALPPEGNSAAFTVTPLPGLTVSAEENALQYDGQLHFSELTESEAEACQQISETYQLGVVAGWKVDAGLEPDAYLPGTFHSELDLAALEIPEELYDSIAVWRLDDNGVLKRYAVHREGQTVSWDSSQNSIILIGCLTVGTVMTAAGLALSAKALWIIGAIIAGLSVQVIVHEKMTEAEIWNSEEVKHLACHETDDYIVWYADPDAYERGQRIQQAVAEAEKKAKEMVEEEYSGLSGWMINWRKERDLKLYRKQILESNAQYQADIRVQAEAPEDVLLLEQTLDESIAYLQNRQGMPKLGYQLQVMFGGSLPNNNDGNAMTNVPFFKNPYIIVKRDAELMNSIAAQNTLAITCTHEIYHIYTHKYINTDDNRHLKFAEMSAMYVERQFIKDREITSYSDTNKDKYETLALQPDDHAQAAHLLRVNGYTLAHFLEFLDGDDTRFSGMQMIRQYKASGSSIRKMIADHFGLQDPELFSLCWSVFIQEKVDAIRTRYEILKEETRDEDGSYPGLMHRINLTPQGEPVRREVKTQPYTCTMVPVSMEHRRTWGMLLVPDEDLTAKLPSFSLIRTEKNDAAEHWQQTAYGTGIVLRKAPFPDCVLAEQQGSGGCGSSGYTVYGIPQPDKPEIELLEDEAFGKYYSVRLSSKGGSASEAGKTDCFLLRITAGSEVLYQQIIPFEEWDQEQQIWEEDIQRPSTTEYPAMLTVCEYIEAAGGCEAFFGPESEPIRIDGEFPTYDTSLMCGGSFGTVPVSSSAHFTLDEKGNFKLTYSAFDDEWEPDEHTSPFEQRRYGSGSVHISGFTVSGHIDPKKIPDPKNWTAEAECSTGSFSASRYVVNPITVDGEPEITDEHWSGSGVSGCTFRLSKADDNMRIQVTVETASGTVSVSGKFKDN